MPKEEVKVEMQKPTGSAPPPITKATTEEASGPCGSEGTQLGLQAHTEGFLARQVSLVLPWGVSPQILEEATAQPSAKVQGSGVIRESK